ncbi:PASTA domain-containing protein [Streptomyces sp. NPDC056399]|uniref:PASTA domain-containing protein n=1 Tax=Streptomyces sp. NPDC056399 TaxID=3345807 RepID=UPI0035DC8B06
MKVTCRALVAAATAVLAACSPESSDPAPAQTATTRPTTEPAPAPETTEPTEGATEEAPAAETAEVPNVVGLNHAEAQSLLRSKGFTVNEEDASPEGRMILNNSNWKVCSQDPQPGATDVLRVAIYSVKLDESC